MIIGLVMLAIPTLSLLFLQNRQVQTRLLIYMTERLSEELQTTVSLSSVNYSFFRRMQVRDLYIEDLYGDTLLYVGLTKLRIKQFRPDPAGITFRKILVEDAFMNLVIDSAGNVNIKHFTDPLKNPHTPPELKPRVHIASINLTDSRFSLSRMGSEQGASPISFNDFHLRKVNAVVNNLEVYQDTVIMEVEGLHCEENSGFAFDEINTVLSINRHFLHFDSLEVRTQGSDLEVPRLWFDFPSYQDFKHFSYRVDLSFISEQSRLKLEDLKQFAPVPGKMLEQVIVDGEVSGKLSDLRGDDLLLAFADRSTLAFDFMMIGLPDFSNTFMDFNFRELRTPVTAVNDLLSNLSDSIANLDYPWYNLGTLDFKGGFTGYFDQFVASGLLKTDMGSVLMDASFDPDSLRGIAFLGSLKTKDFKLGQFLEREEALSQLDMDVFAHGNLYRGQINADLEGRIDTLSLYSYAYSNITLDGAITNNTFEGGFSISDPNIRMDFQGRTDFSGEVPVHRFTADVSRIRPYYLNLPQQDPNYIASFLIETDLSGRSIDKLNGEIVLVNSLFEKTDAQIQIYDLTLSARNTPDASLIRLRSDLLDADITGKYQLTTLPASFRNMADVYLNVIPNSAPFLDSLNYFTYDINLKRIDPVLDFFLPSVEIGNMSKVSGSYDPGADDFQLKGSFPVIGLRGMRWHQVNTRISSSSDLLEGTITSDSLCYTSSYSLANQDFRFSSANDSAWLGIYWHNDTLPSYSGSLGLHGRFQPDSISERAFVVHMDKGELTVNDEVWEIKSSMAELRRNSLLLQDMEMKSSEKMIKADGLASRDGEQDFHLEVKNLDLERLGLITGTKVELEGRATGAVNLQHQAGIPVLLTDLEVDSLWFNGHYLGLSELHANWNDARGNVDIRMQSTADNELLVETSGTYTPENRAIDFDILLRQFSLSAFNPYTEGIVNEMEGHGDVYLELEGSLDAPELNGSVDFSGGEATVDYLNTRYYFEDKIRIHNNNFYLENFNIRDAQGHLATVNGSVANRHLKDFYINLNLDADKVLCMNTRSSDNEVFYGTIYGTGNVLINGSPGGISFKINASTEENTELFLPLYNASEVSTDNFITFIQKEGPVEDLPEIKAKKSSGIRLDLEVDITDDAVVQLIFDPKVGDIIETSGSGKLRMSLDPSNGFRMFGDVELNRGDYLFTLQNVINKRFNIEPGGKISFNGSPMNASVDLEAIYNLRAAPYNLYPDNDEQKEKLKKRIPVECHLILQGELGAPSISTGINMPTADAETRSLLENSTSTDEELMRQFLSLLVINNFYSVTGYGSQEMGTTGSIAGVTASELLSNQLSNWLSQISDDFDIGINYRPGDDVTQDEVEVALSTQLLNDKVIISGNVDVGGQETNPPEGTNNPYVMGDFDVEFRVTDNVSIFAFNRARDELLFETAPYKQGVGISYREEFDNLSQLLARYKEAVANRKKKRKKASEPDSEE